MGLAKTPTIRIIVCLLVCTLILGSGIYWSAIDQNPRVLAELDCNAGKFVVLGKVDGKIDVLLESWSITLWWKRSSPYWACYFLDYESKRWTGVKIRQDKDHIFVTKENATVVDLNLKDFVLLNMLRGTTEQPIALTQDSPLKVEAREEISRDNKSWRAAWQQFLSAGNRQDE
jgi:hypothetical protein